MSPPMGTTVAELMALSEPDVLFWRQIDSRMFVDLVGTQDQDPMYTVELFSERMGTKVRLKYWFDKVQVRGWLCVVSGRPTKPH